MTTTTATANEAARSVRSLRYLRKNKKTHVTSEILDQTFYAEEVPSLNWETLQIVTLECEEALASIVRQIDKAQKDSSSDNDWLHRLKTKQQCLKAFSSICQDEKQYRIKALDYYKQQEKTNRHNEHQHKASRLAILRRKALHGLIKQIIGDDLFSELSQKAQLIAENQLAAEQLEVAP